MHINGELTQGENIADIGGIKLAYAALQKALDKNPQARDQKIDGFTPEQRFFLGWAQVWRANQREDDLRIAPKHRSAFANPLSVQRPGLQHAGIRQGI